MKNIDSNQNLEYWNTIGSQKEFNNPNLILSNLNFLEKESPILDIGCGYGRTLCELRQSGYSNLCGIDYSEVMISRAKKVLGPSIDLRNSPATSIPFSNNTFKVVQLYAVLNCIPNPKEELIAIKEAIRVLKSDGYLLINDFPLSRDINKYEIHSDSFGKRGYLQVDGKCTMRHTSSERIVSMVGQSKPVFESIRTELSMNGNPVEISSQIFKISK